ncbi:BGTF surface domain-containing protein [Halorussus salinisoli]|uniref:BGTF surface domain-containing protein n=1 Tax=Halorussus salinisoli TaxID=2558242 RepID=UPI001485556F|nr:BGTF surface domain-containing protein [Halorussus salinisoli]
MISATISPSVLAVSSLETTNEVALNAESSSFSQTVVRGTRGNTINISASTGSQATLNLGGPEMGFWVQMNISGSTEVTLNTYETDVEEIVSGSSTLDIKGREELAQPLVPATYDMNITIDGREVARGKFIIEPRGETGFTGDIERWASPAAGIDEVQHPSELSNAIPISPENETVVPKGRWVAFRVNTSKFSEGFLRASGNATDKFSASFVEQNPDMNTEPTTFSGTDIEKFVSVPKDDALYFFVNTGRHGINANSTYRVNVTVIGDTPFVDRPESVITNFTVVKPQVGLQRSKTPIIVNSTETIRGSTTFLPGETINITAKYNGVPPFIKPKEATVQSNQTFKTSFDFSDVTRGDTFIITLPDQDKSYQAVRAWEVRINHTGEKIKLSEDATITGEAKLEPGSQFEVQANYDGDHSSFSKSKTVIVTQSGDFSVDFDLSEASPGGNLSVSVPAYNKTVPAVITSTTPTTTASTTESTSTTTTTTLTTTQTTKSHSASETTRKALTQQPITQQTEQSSSPVPGFTFRSTLLAILTVILLVRRHR